MTDQAEPGFPLEIAGVESEEPPEPEVNERDPEKKTQRIIEFPLEEFAQGGLVWAVNYFVLWPLGLALAYDREPRTMDGPDGPVTYDEFTNLRVREWEYVDGEKIETINLTSAENQAAFHEFMSFVQRRVLMMKPDERRLMFSHYSRHEFADPGMILLAD